MKVLESRLIISRLISRFVAHLVHKFQRRTDKVLLAHPLDPVPNPKGTPLIFKGKQNFQGRKSLAFWFERGCETREYRIRANFGLEDLRSCILYIFNFMLKSTLSSETASLIY